MRAPDGALLTRISSQSSAVDRGVGLVWDVLCR